MGTLLHKNKILYLLDDPSKDKHVHKYVLDGLVKEGFLPTIGYFYGKSSDSVMASNHIKAFSLELKKNEFKGINIRAIKKLREYIIRENFSIIHTQRHRPLVYAVLSLLGQDKVLFYTVRATNVLRNLNRRLVFRLFGRNISKIICISNGVKDYVKQTLPFFPSSKIEVIYNGVDLSKFDISITKEEARKFLNIPKEGFYFGIVARLKKAKCHEEIICAFKELTCSFPDTKLAIVGDGPLFERLKYLVNGLKISDKVFFTGRIDYDKVPIALRAFDCFVHPSFREGLGVSVLEAMASALPVIISNAPGIRDIFYPEEDFILEKEIGKMVKAKDVGSLAKAMLYFRGMEKDKLNTIGYNAKKHITKFFTKEVMVKKTVTLYKNFINS